LSETSFNGGINLHNGQDTCIESVIRRQRKMVSSDNLRQTENSELQTSGSHVILILSQLGGRNSIAKSSQSMLADHVTERKKCE
jgi:hypothetical protein